MSLKELFGLELRAIFTDPAILLTVFGGVLFYSFLYPLPYAQQLPREQAVVVVDFDNSNMSRKLIRMVDATPQVNVSQFAYSIDRARRDIEEHGLTGMLIIPRHFYRDLLLGKSATLSYAGDASYFLIYSTIVEGMSSAGGTLAAGIRLSRLLIEGQAMVLAEEQYAPLRVNLRPVFNTTTGYVHYVVPAVFILILHQTLLIGTGLLGAGQTELTRTGKRGYWLHVKPLQLIAVRGLLFTLIYFFLMLFYFGFSFDFYDISRLANPLDLAVFAVPFILATTFLGIIIGQLIPRRELATTLVLISSLPLVFTAGFVWPSSMLPAPVYYLAQLIPSTPGIQGFLRLNQMGAELPQIQLLYEQLWGQTIVYGLTGWYLLLRRKQNHVSGTSTID